jgi:hypothetical protein
MNLMIVFTTLAFAAGMICGCGAERMAVQNGKVTDSQFRRIVNQILKDEAIGAELKSSLMSQLNEYASRADVGLEQLHAALRQWIVNVKTQY